MNPEGVEGAVTTTVTRWVKAGHEPFYESFLEGILAAAARLPGHLGVEVRLARTEPKTRR